MLPGTTVKKELIEAIQKCNIFLAVIGNEWADTLSESLDFVRLEIETALEFKKIIIPVLLNNKDIPEADHLPLSIKSICEHNALRVRVDPDFHNDLDRLVIAINSHLRIK